MRNETQCHSIAKTIKYTQRYIIRDSRFCNYATSKKKRTHSKFIILRSRRRKKPKFEIYTAACAHFSVIKLFNAGPTPSCMRKKKVFHEAADAVARGRQAYRALCFFFFTAINRRIARVLRRETYYRLESI